VSEHSLSSVIIHIPFLLRQQKQKGNAPVNYKVENATHRHQRLQILLIKLINFTKISLLIKVLLRNYNAF